MRHYVPLVGMRYRRPALAFTTNLKPGHPLVLVKEPDNQYDDKAIAVLLDKETLSEDHWEIFAGPLSAFGCSREELPKYIHLGYVARTETQQVHASWPVKAEFALSAAGYPAVAFEADFTVASPVDEIAQDS